MIDKSKMQRKILKRDNIIKSEKQIKIKAFYSFWHTSIFRKKFKCKVIRVGIIISLNE